MKTAPQSRQTNIVVQELHGETLIYDLSLNKAFCLNEASAIVWKACDGEKTLSEITQTVRMKLSSAINEDFVWLALERLKKENLLTNCDEIDSDFNGLSRREVIKKIGFSSMVAIPMITSLVAPSAVHAQSTCGACQCSGLLAPVTVCPPGFADCPQGCQFCNISVNGCFNSGDGVVACNGTCSNQSAQPTCPPSSPGDCTCFGSFNIGQTCPGVQCQAGCGSCRVTATCIPQEVGPPACNGVCA